MQRFTTTVAGRSILGVAMAMLAVNALPASATASASASTLYVYDLANAGQQVANGASANSGVDLSLQGSWSSNGSGVTFQGNLSGKRSVGHADPASGSTIDISGTKAVGAAVVFTFTPPSGASCPKDSQNIAQIGPYAAGQGQVKLQLGNCKSGVLPQCRFAGVATSSSTGPVTGAPKIVQGRSYRFECVKGPDASGKATVTMRLLDIAAGTTTTKTFSIPDTGRIESSKPLSVANKYPLPSATKNTDQFTGVVRHVALCSGDTAAAVQGCLAATTPA